MPRIKGLYTALTPVFGAGPEATLVGAANDFYGIMWREAVRYRRRPTDESNRKRFNLPDIDVDDLPGISRLIKIHNHTSGDLTVDDYVCFIGVTDAQWDKNSIYDNAAGDGKRKWNSFVGGNTGYTSARLSLDGTFRNWFLSTAIFANGCSGAQLAALDAATGIKLITNAEYQAIMPVVPGP